MTFVSALLSSLMLIISSQEYVIDVDGFTTLIPTQRTSFSNNNIRHRRQGGVQLFVKYYRPNRLDYGKTSSSTNNNNNDDEENITNNSNNNDNQRNSTNLSQYNIPTTKLQQSHKKQSRTIKQQVKQVKHEEEVVEVKMTPQELQQARRNLERAFALTTHDNFFTKSSQKTMTLTKPPTTKASVLESFLSSEPLPTSTTNLVQPQTSKQQEIETKLQKQLKDMKKKHAMQRQELLHEINLLAFLADSDAPLNQLIQIWTRQGPADARAIRDIENMPKYTTLYRYHHLQHHSNNNNDVMNDKSNTTALQQQVLLQEPHLRDMAIKYGSEWTEPANRLASLLYLKCPTTMEQLSQTDSTFTDQIPIHLVESLAWCDLVLQTKPWHFEAAHQSLLGHVRLAQYYQHLYSLQQKQQQQSSSSMGQAIEQQQNQNANVIWWKLARRHLPRLCHRLARRRWVKVALKQAQQRYRIIEDQQTAKEQKQINLLNQHKQQQQEEELDESFLNHAWQ